MKKITFLFLFISFYTFSQTPTKAEAVSVNGKEIYYEVYGQGTPLFFLHGYSLSSKSWQPYVADFCKEYQVYLIDLTGHGKSSAFKEDLSIKAVAEDLNALIKHLQIQKMQAVGFSFGGDVLFQLALLNPSLIESMITIGALGTWSVKDFPQYSKSFIFENVDNFSWMRASHASDAQIRGIFNQFKNYIIKVSNAELKSIKPEVLIMLGDDDIGISLEEVARAKKYLPNSDLWILPNVAHGAHEGETKPTFIKTAKAFLTKK